MKHFILFMIGCGIVPIPPIPSLGCKDMKPVCICDTLNHCQWQFECVEE